MKRLAKYNNLFKNQIDIINHELRKSLHDIGFFCALIRKFSEQKNITFPETFWERTLRICEVVSSDITSLNVYYYVDYSDICERHYYVPLNFFKVYSASLLAEYSLNDICDIADIKLSKLENNVYVREILHEK